MADKPNILACPICNSKNISAFVSSGNIPSKGEVRDWQLACRECKYAIDYLSSDGTESSAIRGWNNEVKEFHILKYLNENLCISFDNGIDLYDFIESCNFKERQLKLTLNALTKEYKIEKQDYKAYCIDGLKDGTKYSSYSITEYGKERLGRLKREFKNQAV